MSQSLLAEAVVHSRHNVISYFGILSYSQLKMTYEKRAMLCPFCNSELRDGIYTGSKIFCKDKKSLDYIKESWLPAVENGIEVWHIKPERKPCYLNPEKEYNLFDQ